MARLKLHQIDFSVVMLTVENIDEINEKMGHITAFTITKNFAIQIQQRLDITDSCSRYSLDKILIVLHNADIDEARKFATRLSRELKVEDLLNNKAGSKLTIRISAVYAQAEEDSLLKQVLAKAESKDNLSEKFELK